MLVLSRKASESILIGEPGSPDCVRITLVRIEGDKAKIGVEAPRDVQVMRVELVEGDDT